MWNLSAQHNPSYIVPTAFKHPLAIEVRSARRSPGPTLTTATSPPSLRPIDPPGTPSPPLQSGLPSPAPWSGGTAVVSALIGSHTAATAACCLTLVALSAGSTPPSQPKGSPAHPCPLSQGHPLPYSATRYLLVLDLSLPFILPPYFTNMPPNVQTKLAKTLRTTPPRRTRPRLPARSRQASLQRAHFPPLLWGWSSPNSRSDGV